MDINNYGKIGFGTFGSDKYDETSVANAVYTAIKCGYRIFDCASVYGNEVQIGNVFKRAFAEGIVKREELYIISKVWNDMHGEGQVLSSCRDSIEALGVGHIDLYFMHWPFPNYHAKGCKVDSRNPDSKPFFTEDYMVAWRQMEQLKESGQASAIGMSNMTIPKFEAVLPLCKIKPYAHEMELHPSFQQEELYQYCLKIGVKIIGYCPIGSPNRPERDKMAGDIADTQLPQVTAIAAARGIHSAEVCLKWAATKGHIPIPFSSREVNIISNRVATEGLLTDSEMQSLASADKNCRLVKGHVFLWNGANDWQDLWDIDGEVSEWKYECDKWVKQ